MIEKTYIAALFLAGLIALMPTALRAQQIDPVTGQVINKNAVKKNYQLSLSSFFDTNLYDFSDKDSKSFANSSAIALTYKLESGYRVASSISVAKNLTGERKLLARDSSIRLIKSFGKMNEYFSLVGSAALTVPLSKASHKTAGLITRLRVAPTLIFNISKLIPGGNLFYSPSLSYSIHEFKTLSTGASNSQYSLGHSLAFGYSFLSAFYIQLSGAYSRRWTYQGRSNDSFSFDQSLNYTIGSGLTAVAGHSIGGNALASNGQDSDVQIFDSRESSFYMGLVYTY
jgi:hypothetical protein